MRSIEIIIRITIAFAAIVAAGAFALVALCGESIPLPVGETCAQCARTWVAALGPYVGAILALLAAAWTVGKIQNQIRQTQLLAERQRSEAMSRELSARADALSGVASAASYIRREADKAKKSTTQKEIEDIATNIGSAHGLKAIEARRSQLRRASINNAQCIIDMCLELIEMAGKGQVEQFKAQSDRLCGYCNTEPPRVCRRLHLLSRMEHHEQNDEQIFA